MNRAAVRLDVAAVVAIITVVVSTVLTGCPPTPFDVVDLDEAVIATGTTPNSVMPLRCGGRARLLVVSSGEARLERVDPAGLDDVASAFLGVGSTPWDVAIAGDNTDLARAVVTLPGHHSLALVDPCATPMRLITEVISPSPIDVEPPVTLRDPADVDADGVADVVVSRMTPRTPQAVVAVGSSVLVVWANLLAYSTSSTEPMLSGPGLLTRFTVTGDGESLQETGRVVLPCENPGGLVAVTDDTVVVSCAGRFVVGVDGHRQQSPGGLVRVLTPATGSLVVDGNSVLTDHTPGPIVWANQELVTGDLLDGTVRAFDSATLVEQRSTAPTTTIDSVFALTVTDGDDVVAGWFSGRVQRSPLDNGPARQLTDGPGRGLVDLACDDDGGYGLFSLSAELVPFSFAGGAP